MEINMQNKIDFFFIIIFLLFFFIKASPQVSSQHVATYGRSYALNRVDYSPQDVTEHVNNAHKLTIVLKYLFL